MTTPIFITGAEAGIVTAGAAGLTPVWDQVSAAGRSIDTVVYHSGLRSYKFNPSSAEAWVQKTNISTTRLVATFALYFPSLPTGYVYLWQFTDSQGSIAIYWDYTTSKLATQIGTGTARSSSMTLNAATWYVIDIDANTSGATATASWRVNGVAQTQATNVQASASMTALTLGLHSITNSFSANFDDIVLSYTAGDYPIGSASDDGYSVKVLGFSPNVDGVHDFTADDFKYNAAGGSILVTAIDVYTYVDERPIDNGGDFINNAVSRASNTKYVQVGFEDTTETGNALGLEVVSSQHAASASANNAAMNLNDNNTISAVYALTDISQTSLIFHSKQFATAPSTSSAWTQERINALLLRWGYSTDANPDAYLDGVILEIAYPVIVVQGDITITLTDVMPATGTNTAPIGTVVATPIVAMTSTGAYTEPALNLSSSMNLTAAMISIGGLTTPFSMVQANLSIVMPSSSDITSPIGMIIATPISTMTSTGASIEPVLNLSSAIILEDIMVGESSIVMPISLLQADIPSVMTGLGNISVPTILLQAVIESSMGSGATLISPIVIVQADLASVLSAIGVLIEPSIEISGGETNITISLLVGMPASTGILTPATLVQSDVLAAMESLGNLTTPTSILRADLDSSMTGTGGIISPNLSLSSLFSLPETMLASGTSQIPVVRIQADIGSLMTSSSGLTEPALSLSLSMVLTRAMQAEGILLTPSLSLSSLLQLLSAMIASGMKLTPSVIVSATPTSAMTSTGGVSEPTLSLSSLFELLSRMEAVAPRGSTRLLIPEQYIWRSGKGIEQYIWRVMKATEQYIWKKAR